MTRKLKTVPRVRRPKRPAPDWQTARIKAGIADARAGRVCPADQVFAEIAAEHGWKR